MPVKTVTDDTFESVVENANLPVLVDFGTEWCAPCKQIEPTLASLSEDLEGRVKIVKVNIDNAPETAMKLGVRGIPALFIFQNGEIIANRTGNASKRALEDWIEASV